MQKFNRVMIVIDWLFAVAGGLALLYVAVADTSGPDVSIEIVPEANSAVTVLPPPVLIVIGVVMLALNIIWLILTAKGLKSEECTTFQTENGNVKTAVSAIDESLARTAQLQPEVGSARVRLVIGPDNNTPQRIVASVSFFEIQNQIGAQQVLQASLLKRFKEIVGTVDDVPVDINVTRFVTEKRSYADKKSTEEEKKDKKSGDEFRGPRYPVG